MASVVPEPGPTIATGSVCESTPITAAATVEFPMAISAGISKSEPASISLSAQLTPSVNADLSCSDDKPFSTSIDPEQISVLTNSDRKSTRLNSSHVSISYAVFCLKKKKKSYLTTCGHKNAEEQHADCAVRHLE